MMVDVPAGYSVRRPAREDLASVAELIAAHDFARFGEATASAESLAQTWNLPRFVPDKDGWLVEDVRGRLAGYAGILVWDPQVEMHADLYVHPDDEESGIDGLLLSLVEKRARELVTPASQDRPARLGIDVPRADERRRNLFEAAGYAVDRSSYRMIIDLPARLSRLSPPAGISIRPLQPGHDERLAFAAADEAFQDSAHYVSQPFEDFVHSDLENPLFDPDLWLLAWDGDEVVGVAASYDYPTGAEVDALAVRRPWRRRGIAKALLLQSFAAFAQRGRSTVCLFVNAANEQGAVRLYESVGMRASQVFDCFTKDLLEARPSQSSRTRGGDAPGTRRS